MLVWVKEFKVRMDVATTIIPNNKQHLHQLYLDGWK